MSSIVAFPDKAAADSQWAPRHVRSAKKDAKRVTVQRARPARDGLTDLWRLPGSALNTRDGYALVVPA
jgi:hypothetical protein